MFGYVLPPLQNLPEEETVRFRDMYCGLCHTLRQRYGLAARFILNYDFTFLAILLSDAQPPACEQRRCIASPFKKRSCACQSAALELAADESVILAYWQLRDGITDHSFFKGLKYRLSALVLTLAYRKARKIRPLFDQSVREELGHLSELEEARCDSVDAAAHPFAQLLSAAADSVSDPVRRRVLHQMLYHLGRWVYLIDAADDLKKDWEAGNYNPLIYRYQLTGDSLDEESRKSFVQTLDGSVHMVATAFELWDFGCWTRLLEATVYTGLFQVGKAVLDGSFQPAYLGKKIEIPRLLRKTHE